MAVVTAQFLPPDRCQSHITPLGSYQISNLGAHLPDIREASELKPRSLVGAAMLAGRCAIASSFRLHRPRGAFCHSGWCQQCRIATPDGPRLACRLAENSHPLPQI